MFLTSADDVRPRWRRPWRGLAAGMSGLLPSLAGAVAVIWGDLADAPAWYLTADLVGGVLACAGIWLCRRWPVAAGLAVIALSVPAASASVAAGIAALIAALYRRPRVAMAVGAAGVVATLARFALRPPGLAPYPVWALVGVLLGVAVTGWGMLARTRRELLVSLAERARRAETDQRLRAEEARRAERLGIAREMHDVLAHRLSLLAVHAGALEFNADATPDEVAEAAGVIRSSARLALEELRTVVSVLRDTSSPSSPIGSPSAGEPPTEGPAGGSPWVTGGSGVDLGALVEESRRAGMRVELHDHGIRLSEVPDATGRAAYRIVQEGLTNARKHAPGRPVTVLLSGAAGTGLAIELRNPLPAGPPPGPGGSAAGESGELAATGAGAGLGGLAERASQAGGRLESGAADGGFRLAAWLPWPR